MADTQKILDALAKLTSKVENLDTKVSNLNLKIYQFSKLAADHEKRISDLEISCNNNEQHQRSHSIRIWKFPLEDENSKDTFKVSQQVYKALTPILKLATTNKLLPKVPAMMDIIDIAHPLPKSKNGASSIIVRLRSKLFREAIMRCKKSYFEENPDQTFSISDDLTKPNAQLLKHMRNRPDIDSAWSYNGKIKYKTRKDPHKICTASLKDQSAQKGV